MKPPVSADKLLEDVKSSVQEYVIEDREDNKHKKQIELLAEAFVKSNPSDELKKSFLLYLLEQRNDRMGVFSSLDNYTHEAISKYVEELHAPDGSEPEYLAILESEMQKYIDMRDAIDKKVAFLYSLIERYGQLSEG